MSKQGAASEIQRKRKNESHLRRVIFAQKLLSKNELDEIDSDLLRESVSNILQPIVDDLAQENEDESLSICRTDPVSWNASTSSDFADLPNTDAAELGTSIGASGNNPNHHQCDGGCNMPHEAVAQGSFPCGENDPSVLKHHISTSPLPFCHNHEEQSNFKRSKVQISSRTLPRTTTSSDFTDQRHTVSHSRTSIGACGNNPDHNLCVDGHSVPPEADANGLSTSGENDPSVLVHHISTSPQPSCRNHEEKSNFKRSKIEGRIGSCSSIRSFRSTYQSPMILRFPLSQEIKRKLRTTREKDDEDDTCESSSFSPSSAYSGYGVGATIGPQRSNPVRGSNMTSEISGDNDIVMQHDDIDDFTSISPLSFGNASEDDEKVSLSLLAEGTVSCANGVGPFSVKGKTFGYFYS